MREVMDAAGTEALEAAIGTGSKIVPMFGQEGIDDLPPERYSAALLDAVLAGWSLEDTKVAILQDWIKGRKGEGEEMSGLVVREMEKLGGEAPVNQRLVEISRRIESGELQPGHRERRADDLGPRRVGTRCDRVSPFTRPNHC